MRRILALVILLLAPGALATPPQEPYLFDATFSAPPIVGETVTLTLRIDARSALDAPLRIEAPEWVRIEGAREWDARIDAGASAEHTWRVSATRAGFWRASLSVDTSRASAYGEPVDPARAWQPVGGCCAFVFSEETRARWGPLVGDALPVPEANVTLFAAALDAERADLVVRIAPESAWLAHEDLMVQFLSSDDMMPERAPGDAPREFRRAFPLAPGNGTVVAASAGAWVTFDDGLPDVEDAMQGASFGCVNLQVEREGDTVRETGRWSCEASATRTRGVPGPQWPAAGFAFVASALLLVRPTTANCSAGGPERRRVRNSGDDDST